MRKKLVLATITVAALAATLFTPTGFLTSTGQQPAEKRGAVSAEQYPPRSILVGSTDLLTTNERPMTSAAPGDHKRTITVGGRVRSYLLHIPSSPNKGKPMPVVIVLHGGGGNAEGIAETSGFTAKSDEERFIVIYPNGTGRLRNRLLTWNSGNCCGYAHENNVDDVSFIRSLIAQVQKELNVDGQRIFVTGFSNGGMMSYRLACELSDKIAAIAPVAGALNYEKCNPVQPVSLVAFHGTADEHVLYEGGEPRRRVDRNPRVDRSVAEAIGYWVKRNRCANSARKERRGGVVIEDYAGCGDGTGVRLYTLEGQGHAWPGGAAWARRADEPTTAVKATDAMWEFFSSHPKRQRFPTKRR